MMGTLSLVNVGQGTFASTAQTVIENFWRSDAAANGNIVDQCSPVVTAVVLATTIVVPTLSEWSPLLPSGLLLLGFVGVTRSGRVRATKR